MAAAQEVTPKTRQISTSCLASLYLQNNLPWLRVQRHQVREGGVKNGSLDW